MEQVIDRTCYRRSNMNDNRIKKKRHFKENLLLKKFLIQLLFTSLVLLGVSFLAYFDMSFFLNDFYVAFNKEMVLEDFYADGKKVYEYAVKILDEEDMFEDSTVEENLPVDAISALSTDLPYEVIYESAVEGVNQLSDDAKYILDNYSLNYPLSGVITSVFGVRVSSNPIVSEYHSGIDIAANIGTKIRAALDGTVIAATTDVAYGKYLMIKKDDVVIVYAHCSKLLLKVGDKVKKGDTIALVGSTGYSTGPHLHFEIRFKDRLINPANVLDFGV